MQSFDRGSVLSDLDSTNQTTGSVERVGAWTASRTSVQARDTVMRCRAEYLGIQVVLQLAEEVAAGVD